MNEDRKGYAEESRAWEKERVEKEYIRLDKQFSEKHSWLKNKLKWLNKEPRAAFFYFFYLALYGENTIDKCAQKVAKSFVDPFSAEALGIVKFDLTISEKPSVHQGDGVASLGVMTSDFNLDVPENKPDAETSEPQNSLLLLASDKQETLEGDLDELIRILQPSTLKNKPANGVFFPNFVAHVKGVENIIRFVTNTFLYLDAKNIASLTTKINDAWSKVYADFPEVFSWMDIKNEEQCVWVWETMKNKGVSPPLNPLNNYQRWYFICATFDFWNGWTNAQLEELKRSRKKVSQQFLVLTESPTAPQKHKAVLMDELEKAWGQQLRRKKSKTGVDALKLPTKSKKQLFKLSNHYGVSETEIMVNLLEHKYSEIIKSDKG